MSNVRRQPAETEMFELLANGPYTIGGTLVGLALALGMHKLVPSEPSALYFEAGFVALGFVVGLVLDGRRARK